MLRIPFALALPLATFPVLPLATLAATLGAQTPPCIANNDATLSVSGAITLSGFSGPNVSAFQFTPATTHVLFAAEVFTQSQFATTSGYMSLEIWDEDPSTSLPGARLAGGTWQVHQNLGLEWHGCSFDAPAVVNAATNYWLVWREPGGSRIPYETGGVTMPLARFAAGAWTLQPTPQPLKWRGYCTQLDAANVLPLGTGCASSTGSMPAAFTNHTPTVGNLDFQVDASGFAAGTIGLAIVGANPGWVAIPIPPAPSGCTLHVDPMVVVTVPVGLANQQAQHTTGCAGHCWLDIAIPANPALAGFVLDVQFAGLDAASTAALPFVFTNGVRATIL